MKYDLVNDEVIVMSTGDLEYFDVQLVRENIDKFSFDNRVFAFYNSNDIIDEGFYEEAFKNEKITFLVKYHKTPVKKKGSKFTYYTFKYKEDFYLKKEENYFKVRSLKDIQKILDLNIDSNVRSTESNFRSSAIKILNNKIQ